MNHHQEDVDTRFPVQAIGKVYCPFTEKFAVPRQPGLTPSIISNIYIYPPFNSVNAFEQLEQFSHIWVIFRFHQNLDQGWRPQVRPPRLGGNEKCGVFATRSSFRPNGLGLSVVELREIIPEREQTILQVSGLDVVDQTPVYDIKPYISYCDALPSAICGFASSTPETVAVTLEDNAKEQLQQLVPDPDSIARQVAEALAQDPRPAYRKAKSSDDNIYGFSFADLNFKWRVYEDKICIFEVTRARN